MGQAGNLQGADLQTRADPQLLTARAGPVPPVSVPVLSRHAHSILLSPSFMYRPMGSGWPALSLQPSVTTCPSGQHRQEPLRLAEQSVCMHVHASVCVACGLAQAQGTLFPLQENDEAWELLTPCSPPLYQRGLQKDRTDHRR